MTGPRRRPRHRGGSGSGNFDDAAWAGTSSAVASMKAAAPKTGVGLSKTAAHGFDGTLVSGRRGRYGRRSTGEDQIARLSESLVKSREERWEAARAYREQRRQRHNFQDTKKLLAEMFAAARDAEEGGGRSSSISKTDFGDSVEERSRLSMASVRSSISSATEKFSSLFSGGSSASTASSRHEQYDNYDKSQYDKFSFQRYFRRGRRDDRCHGAGAGRRYQGWGSNFFKWKRQCSVYDADSWDHKRNDKACSLEKWCYESWAVRDLEQALDGSSFAADLGERLRETAPSVDEVDRVNRCLQELNGILIKSCPTWTAVPFGSQATGIALSRSDLDVACLNADGKDSRDWEDARSVHLFLRNLRELLQTTTNFQVAEAVFSARVPILRIRFEDELDVDLSCRNSQPLRNTRLLRAYANSKCGAIRDLCRTIKLWAKAAKVTGACQRHLSTYAFSLMAIYFMQVDPEVQLPCLSVGAFEWGSPSLGDWSCPLPLHVLVARFFRFYEEQFAWGVEVVSVRLGRRQKAESRHFSHLSHRAAVRVHVEDPFQLERNLHDVLGEQQEQRLRAAFSAALHVVLAGNTPQGLGAEPTTGNARVGLGLGQHAADGGDKVSSRPAAKTPSPVLFPRDSPEVVPLLNVPPPAFALQPEPHSGSEESSQDSDEQKRALHLQLLRKLMDMEAESDAFEGRQREEQVQFVPAPQSSKILEVDTVILPAAQCGEMEQGPAKDAEPAIDEPEPPLDVQEEEVERRLDEVLHWGYYVCCAYTAFAICSGTLFRLGFTALLILFLYFVLRQREADNEASASEDVAEHSYEWQSEEPEPEPGSAGSVGQVSEPPLKLAKTAAPTSAADDSEGSGSQQDALTPDAAATEALLIGGSKRKSRRLRHRWRSVEEVSTAPAYLGPFQ
eukprot:TRINITY_DN8760_c0_g2_i1.p1 TRINITY_DN8760_c0_g2~~TRINITY_DN8760_c0_g2_i1.p1  ORF type:complete len:903 (-),score=167.08 TRINITY_DN8760_c0_g2_i1:107-2815(-)